MKALEARKKKETQRAKTNEARYMMTYYPPQI